MNTFFKEKEGAELFYQEIQKVYCPYFNTFINFNNKGFSHIKTKAWNRARSLSDQYLRFKFLRLAPLIIKKSATLQEFRGVKKLERRKSNNKWSQEMVSVYYYAFIAIINNVRIKIIIKQVNDSQKYFWSIIPFWKNEKDKIYQTTKKVFHEGDPEED